MKHLFLLIILAASFTSCSNSEQVAGFPVTTGIIEDLTPVAKVGGFKKVEYQIVNDDESGKPFKIKLYLSGKSEYCRYTDGELSRRCASVFVRKVHHAEEFELVEVNLADSNDHKIFVFQASEL